MQLKNISQTAKSVIPYTVYGEITEVRQGVLIAKKLDPAVGDMVKIIPSKTSVSSQGYGIVTAIAEKFFYITPFGFTEGLRPGDQVSIVNVGMQIDISEDLLGRVINPFMQPIDGGPNIQSSAKRAIIKAPIKPLNRAIIDEVFTTGVKTIDALLTVGKGQKLGIFAGSGVGKSSLLSMIVKGSQAPIKVIALIGERGREIPEFINHNLGADLTNTVIVVATSDDSALLRKYGAFAAMSVAEYFKDQGQDVLFIMDSVTRFAMAQREIGLSLGEPPTTKGYPPSVFMLLPQLMERAGKEQDKGSITAFFTVLIEGDDINDPIGDQARSILDGHIFLDRKLVNFSIYPPINILNSASRVMTQIVSKEHMELALKFRKLYSLLQDNETLLKIGAYTAGSDPDLDEAVQYKDNLYQFLQQNLEEQFNFDDVLQQLTQVLSSEKQTS